MEQIHPASVACEVPVFFATTEGQTERIADRLAEALRRHGLDSRAFNLAGSDADYIDWARVKGALVGASLHMQRYQRTAEAFIRAHQTELNDRPTGFFAVSLSAASHIPEEAVEAKKLANEFVGSLAWHPVAVASFAGCLAYTHYGFLKRFLMKRIARKEGASTDTSHDHEYTDWNAVDRFAADMAPLIARAPRSSVTHPTAA